MPSEIRCKDRAAWRTWLERNHTRAESVWLIYHRKSSGRASISYGEAVEEGVADQRVAD